MIPEIVVVGHLEMFFLGIAFALGMPRAARRIMRARYGEKGEDAQQ